MSYILGNVIRVQVDFKDSAGAAIDPTTVLFKVIPADGSEMLTGSGTKLATGSHAFDVLANASGSWKYRVTGSGNITVAVEGSFDVAKTIGYFGN